MPCQDGETYQCRAQRALGASNQRYVRCCEERPTRSRRAGPQSSSFRLISEIARTQALLDYCIEDLEATDFNLGGSARWFHAPWLAREPLHGLTAERSSQPRELHPLQTSRWENFAVGYYNEYGAAEFGRVWADRNNPDPRNVRFPIGTVSCKLLFTRATPAEVPYLHGSKVWRVAYRDGVAADFRLLQFDIAVRDARVDPLTGTGWVFGTFMHFNVLSNSAPFSFANLVPVGLMWGNNPGLLSSNVATYTAPREGWINPTIGDYFARFRTPTPHLGLHGRINGPVDSNRSACLACHGRALTFPNDPNWTPAERNARLPFNARDMMSDTEVAQYVRNLRPDEPFLAGAESADYSLQLAMGIENFNAWKLRTGDGPSTPSGIDVARRDDDDGGSPPGDDGPSWTDIVPEAGDPARGN